MPKSLKLDRKNIDRDIVNRKIGELKQETEETEELGEKYKRDETTLERLIASVEASDLPLSEKQAQLASLRESQRILYNYYKKEVQDEIERINEESEDLLEKVEDTAQEVKQQQELMEKARIETGTVTLDHTIDKQKEYYDYLEKIKTEEADELINRQKNLEILRRHMERGKGKSL